jgi:hypothetical protein
MLRGARIIHKGKNDKQQNPKTSWGAGLKPAPHDFRSFVVIIRRLFFTVFH